jgi:hypothetical protein
LVEQHRAPRSGWGVGSAFLRYFLAAKKYLALRAKPDVTVRGET